MSWTRHQSQRRPSNRPLERTALFLAIGASLLVQPPGIEEHGHDRPGPDGVAVSPQGSESEGARESGHGPELEPDQEARA